MISVLVVVRGDGGIRAHKHTVVGLSQDGQMVRRRCVGWSSCCWVSSVDIGWS